MLSCIRIHDTYAVMYTYTYIHDIYVLGKTRSLIHANAIYVINMCMYTYVYVYLCVCILILISKTCRKKKHFSYILCFPVKIVNHVGNCK